MYMYSLSPACKNYKGSNFVLGGLLVPLWGDLDKKWRPGFERERARLGWVSMQGGLDERWCPISGREQGWCWFQWGVVWTKGGPLVWGESRFGVGFSAGWFEQKLGPWFWASVGMGFGVVCTRKNGSPGRVIKKLGVGDLKNLQYICMMYNIFYFCFYCAQSNCLANHAYH